MVNLTLGAGEIIAILGAIVTLAWALLKVTINQFEKRLDIKFNSLDSLVLEVKKLEIEQLRRDNQYSEKFVTKAEMDSCQVKHDKVVERIFALLQTMSDKLDNKANKVDCDIRCRTKDRN
jgi:hypothetical protein